MVQQTAQSRRSVSLDGEWQFVTDPDGDGAARGLHEPDADWSGAHEVTVPHAWQEDDRYREYTGTAWYRRTVEYDGRGERAFLRFGAVDYEATVYVDGREAGTNPEGYLPFEVEVTDHLTPGENAVVVRVTDPADLTEVPHGKQGDPWYTRVSGVWQSVTLETRPGAFVSDVQATPNLDDDSVEVGVTVDAGGDGQTAADATALEAEVTVHRDGDEVVAGACELDDGSGSCHLSVPDADYWTPDEPDLYDLRVDLRAGGDIVDSHADYFGMRSVSTDDERLYLNGEPLYVRGALDQAYYPDRLYNPFDVDQLGDGVGDQYANLFEYEVDTAKQLGFNMLRKHIKPAHPDFVEAADRLGMLVWQEPANPTIYTDRSKREVREQLRGMIDRDYNSPSVVIWSLYNEEWGIGLSLDNRTDSDHPDRLWNDPEKQEYLTDLYHEAKEWDPTRLVCDNSGWAHVATDLNDYHEYYASPDRHGAWEEGLAHLLANPGENYGVENTPADEAPVLVSEFGTWGFPDLPALRDHYGGDPPWFTHDFLDVPLKRPEGVDDRFESTDLPDVFGDYDALAEAWQTRESVSLQGVIEEMRIRDEMAGYVITEFSDIEWEFNGVLDYLRERKSFADEFARLNADLLVSVDPASHVVAPGEEVPVDVHVVNDTGDSLTGTLRWDGPGTEGAREVSVDGFGTTTFEAVATVAPPTDAETGPGEVAVTFDASDREVTGSEPVFVVGAEPTGDRALYADEALADALGERHTVVDSVDDADVAVVTEVTDEVSAFVVDGGRAVVVPEPDGRMAASDAFEYRNLPTADSWNLVASLLYQDSDLFAGLATDARVGWAFEDLFPYDLVADLDDADAVYAGSVEGWLANYSSPLVVRARGDGQLCGCTFRVTDAYGEHPTATALLDRLVDRLSDGAVETA
ncbi:MAG: sugar-binding domain-containing protein [Haloarculaceae archaeon]